MTKSENVYLFSKCRCSCWYIQPPWWWPASSVPPYISDPSGVAPSQELASLHLFLNVLSCLQDLRFSYSQNLMTFNTTVPAYKFAGLISGYTRGGVSGGPCHMFTRLSECCLQSAVILVPKNTTFNAKVKMSSIKTLHASCCWFLKSNC